MFWTDWGQKPLIERAAMDGTLRRAIINERLYWPNGLAIDYPTNTLYFADAKLDFIDACDYDGQNRRQVIGSSFVSCTYYVSDIFQNWLIVIERELLHSFIGIEGYVLPGDLD